MANYDALGGANNETEDEKKAREEELRAIEDAYTKKPIAENERRPTLAESLMSEDQEDENKAEYDIFGGQEEEDDSTTESDGFMSDRESDDGNNVATEAEPATVSESAESEALSGAAENAQAESEENAAAQSQAENEPDPIAEQEPETPEEPAAEEEPEAPGEPSDQEETEETPDTIAESEMQDQETEVVAEEEPEVPAETPTEEEPQEDEELAEELDPIAEQEPETPEEPAADEQPENLPGVPVEEIKDEPAPSQEPEATEARSEESEDQQWESVRSAYNEEAITDEERQPPLPEDFNEDNQNTQEEAPEQDEWEMVQEAYRQEAIKDEDRNVELPEELKTREEAEPVDRQVDQEQQNGVGSEQPSGETRGNSLAAPAAFLLANHLSNRRDKNIERNIDQLAKDLKETQHDARSYQARSIRNEAQTAQEARNLGNETAGAEKISQIIAASPYAQRALELRRPLSKQEYDRISEQTDYKMPEYREYLRSLNLDEREIQVMLNRNEMLGETETGILKQDVSKNRLDSTEKTGFAPAGGTTSPVAGSSNSHQNPPLPPHIANSELFSRNSQSIESQQDPKQEFYRKSVKTGVIIGAFVAIIGMGIFLLAR